MAITHKCDACKKALTGDRTEVGIPASFTRFEFCAKCAGPILKVLKSYKLAA